jgi:hypothetical protein
MSRQPRLSFGSTSELVRKRGLGPWCDSIKACPPGGCCTFECGSQRVETLCDLWSLSHMFWGMVTGLTTYWIGWSSMFVTVGAAVLFEIFENTEFGSAISATVCCENVYPGDNMWNSIFDVIFNTFGGFITALIMIENGWVA